MAKMNDNAESFGMKINIKRTQVIKISKSKGRNLRSCWEERNLQKSSSSPILEVLSLKKVTVEETSVRELQVQRMPSLRGKRC